MNRSGELEAIRFVETDLTSLVQATIQQAITLPELADASIDFEMDDHIVLRLVPEVIHFMLLNLIINAGESGKNAQIHVVQRLAAGKAVLEVHDNGPGIPSEQREKIFQPHFTTKLNHAGLGLLAVESAVKVHRGGLAVSDSPLGGAAIVIGIPLAGQLKTSQF